MKSIVTLHTISAGISLLTAVVIVIFISWQNFQQYQRTLIYNNNHSQLTKRLQNIEKLWILSRYLKKHNRMVFIKY